MKASQRARQHGDLASLQLAALELRRERAVLVITAHLDQIVDRLRVILVRLREAAGARRHRAHGEIQIGGQAAVQPHLLLAHLAPPLRRPVIEKREHQRLLQLVGAIARQEHPRDMGLADIDLVGPAGVKVRAGERGADVLGGHRGDTGLG